METTPEKLLTVQELARRLDVGQDKIRDLAREGRIPFLLVGASMRFELAAVLAALRIPTPSGVASAAPRSAQTARRVGS